MVCFDIGELKASGINIAMMFVYDTIDVPSERLHSYFGGRANWSYMGTKHCGGVIDVFILMHLEKTTKMLLRKEVNKMLKISKSIPHLLKYVEICQYRSSHSENFESRCIFLPRLSAFILFTDRTHPDLHKDDTFFGCAVFIPEKDVPYFYHMQRIERFSDCHTKF